MPDSKHNQNSRDDRNRHQRDDKRAENASGGGPGNKGKNVGGGGASGNSPGKQSSGAFQRGVGGTRLTDDKIRRGAGGGEASRLTGEGQQDDDIEIIEPTKKKYTGRCRLFVGNLPLDLKEVDIRKQFEEFGTVSECFMSGKGFAFIRLDTRAHAEAAKEALDGNMVNNRPMRIRFAVHGAAIRVKELSPYVSNELLYKAFSQFGNVERAVHVVDEKGRPTGEGIVEFERKPGALDAMRRVGEGVLLLTSNPRPITVEPLEPRDEDDGQPERMIPRNTQMVRELQEPPRFALPGTFEHEFGNRWKELFHMEKVRREQLEQELRESRERLEADMDVAFQDYQAMLMREDLRRRQEELERLEAARKERMEALRRRDEERASRRPDIIFGGQRGFPVAGFGPPPLIGQLQQEHSQGIPPPFPVPVSVGGNERSGSEGGRGPGGPPSLFGTPAIPPDQAAQQGQAPDVFQNQPPMRMYGQEPGPDFPQNKRRRF